MSNPVNIVKNPLCISTWNVTSLVSNSSKMYQLGKGVDDYGLELLGVTETHMAGSGTQTLSNGAVLVYSGRSNGVRREGVGVVLSKKMKNTLISYTPVSGRVMTARLHSKHINISVTVVYAPTEDAEISLKDSFYKELNDVQSGLPAHDIKIVLGDFNARVGRDTDAHPGVIGKHSYHTESNDNGKRMLDFCTMHQLTIGGTLFEHKDIHKTTWRSPNGNTVTQIDHMCISTRWSHSLLDVRSMRGADINTTHYLVRGYVSIKLKCPQKRKKRVRQPALEHLRDRSKSQEYSNRIAEEYYNNDQEHGNSPLEEQWQNLRDIITDVSFEVLGERGRKKRTEHLSRDTKNLLKERGEIKKKPSTAENRAKYSRINGLVRQNCKRDDNAWAVRIAEELEDAAKQGQQRDVWQKIKSLTNKRVNRSAAVRDKNGTLISDPEAQSHRWAEYFEELLTPAANAVDFSILDQDEKLLSFEYLSNDDEPPSLFEIEEAIKKLKNYKSAGIDEISNEQLKYGSPGLLPWLKDLFETVWKSEDIPNDWRKGIITIIPKKGDLTYCNNNREKFKNISRGFTLQYRQSSRQPEKCVIDLDYADDIAGMDDTVEGLQETTDNIAKYCGLGGLKMNAKKTEIMVIGKDTSQHPLPENRTIDITVDGNSAKQK
ncbi:uncharacterized protein LOC134823648 [Bolinopsis microptera]|uniref:uncharacterized protein LOC134823648 n=1 Tax=Bolinopsis microptera TaxID=2820187 RepID=UPI003079DA61